MIAKIFVLLFIPLIFGSCSSSKKTSIYSSDRIKNVNYRESLKDLAFCSCIKYGYQKDSIFQKDVSMSVYTELTNYDIESYKVIDSVIMNTISNIRPLQTSDYAGRKAILYESIEFYKSKRLQCIIDSLLKR